MSDTPVLDKITSAQNQFLDYLDRNTEPAADLVRRAAENLARNVPADRLPTAEQLRRLSEVLDSQFDFAAALLERQRKLAHAAIEAATPATSGLVSVSDTGEETAAAA